MVIVYIAGVISGPPTPHGFEVSRPNNLAAPVNCSAKKTTCIYVVSVDKVVVNDKQLPIAALRDTLETMYGTEGEPMVEEPNIYVIADPNLDFQDVIRAIDVTYNSVIYPKLILVTLGSQNEKQNAKTHGTSPRPDVQKREK